MIYRFFVFLLFFSATGLLSAQPENLVPNGGFEERDLCIYNDSYINDCYPWFNPGNLGNGLILGGTPDLFHACAIVNEDPCPYPENAILDPWFFGVPSNTVGCEDPYEGDGYAGAFFFFPNFTDPLLDGYREYLAVRLTEPLEEGVEYSVSMQVSLAERMTSAIWNFQVLFSPDSLFQENSQYLNQEPQLGGTPGDYIDNKEGWSELAWSYIAEGNEVFMYIGNFQPGSETDTLSVNEGSTDGHYGGAYYYIDDVKVISNSLTSNFHVPGKSNFWPNPTVDYLHYKGLQSFYFEIFNQYGQRVLNGVKKSGDHALIDLSLIDSGLYLLHIVGEDEKHETHKIIKR